MKPQRKQNNQSIAKIAGHNYEHPLDLIDSGLYCCGVLHGVGITALVDSGATATMISDTVYNKLLENKRPLLKPVDSRMVAANGEVVTTIGMANFTLF